MREADIEWRNFGVPMVAAPRPLAPPTLPGLIAVAAIGSLVAMLLFSCLLAMQMATERQRVAALDTRIALARHQLAVLDKEAAIRGRYEQLDRWNAALGLATPRVDQYLAGDAALAALSPRTPRLALTRDRLPEI